MTEKVKKFYAVSELIWLKDEKKKGKVINIDVKNKEVTVSYFVGKDKKDTVVKKFWEITKLRKTDEIYFAKVRPDAKIPSRRFEDGAYDFYACFDEDMIVLKPNTPTLISTGIASAFSPKYRLNLKHERGSTGKLGMSCNAGIIDSGYRNIIFVNLININNKPITITKTVNEIEETDDYILYPYTKAIAQATLEYVPNVIVKEISYDELKNIPSERGMGNLGNSGK